ncbi:methyltransferase domain-containing protein [Staphylospora marina]|uniref:methyltransferase domain-containing protein n=1 Tax=Staphylospora marina TaxID=2490858 RepID=UPI000F5BEC61|nr:methyltransferase domain-containing protein [Staphylospora marina]
MEITYMGTVLPGFEGIARDEIVTKLRAMIVDTYRGKVLFKTDASPDSLFILRSVDNLYLFIKRFSMGPHKVHLNDLERTVARLDLTAVEKRVAPAKHVTFVVNASRSGKHTYSRFDLSEAATRGILKQRLHWVPGTAERHLLEFRLDVMDQTGLFSLRLTPPEFRWRGRNRGFSRAALRPTVAHALVWLSRPQESQTFLDPFCGSGTILAERLHYPARRMWGGDLSEEALDAARNNLHSQPHLSLHRWDARNLPLDAASVDRVVTNLPFGRQILHDGEIRPLYLGFMKELKRILSPDGQAILMTDRTDDLEAAASKLSLSCETISQVSLKGLHPKVFRIRK